MDNALRMNDDIDFFGRQPEEPMRLDHFETLVHQGCGIDSDLVAHPPGRMIERTFDRNLIEAICRQLAKRPARGGKDNSLYGFRRTALNTLKDRVMLATHRQ